MDATQRERSSRKVRPGNWLRIALFNLVFIVVPLGIYFVFYVDSRIEQITVRNFRALDAASERLRVVIDNLPKVAGNVPVGLSSAALSQARRVLREAAPSTGQSELAAELAAARSRRAVAQRRVEALSREASVPRSKSSLQSLLDEVRQQQAAVVGDLRRAQAELRRSDDELADLERRLRYASGEADCLDSSAIRDLVGLDATYSAYLEDFRSVPGATGFQVGALKRRAPAAATGDACAEAASKELRRQLDRALVTTATCEHEGVRRRLILQRPEGIGLEVRDCQPFDRRAEALSRAIATEALRGVLDEYGVRIFSRLDTIVAGVAANVAPLFDQYLITDANGRVLYAASSGGGASRVDDVVGTPNGRNVRVDFVSQVDLGALVRNEARSASSALDDSLDALGARAGGSDDRPWVRYGVHSRLETISVADITFNVFVHPFEVPGVEFDLAVDDGDGAEDAGRGDGTPAARPPVLYMIGIVDRASLSDEALRLRLSVVVDALLLLGVLFTSFAMLWLWTAGDRLVLFTRHFVLVLATGLLGALLYTLFGMHLVSRGIDANALDHSMATVSHRLREGFAQELQRRLADLAVATEEMLSGDYEAEAAASSPVLRERFYCRPRGGWPPDDEGDGARY
ncbi:MAG: hypothetical protein V2J24_11945 [Pseudomonadales bacterium]|nr:hypothetical protein [Pseudomonadales bacterium]